MLTKAQKTAQIENAEKLLGESRSLLFVDFAKTPTKEMDALRAALRDAGAVLKIVKKRLLNIALKRAGAECDPTQFPLQVGTVFAKGDASSVAGLVWKFAKGKKEGFRMLGAYELDRRAFFGKEEIEAFGKLPSREILLAQTVGMLAAPVRMLFAVLKARQEKLTVSA